MLTYDSYFTRKNPLRGFCLAPPGGVRDKILKCDKKVCRKHGITIGKTDGTTDIGDYVDCIFD